MSRRAQSVETLNLSLPLKIPENARKHKQQGSRNYAPNPHSQVRTLSSNLLTNIDETLENRQCSKLRRILQSPRLNGDSIVEYTNKLAGMDFTRAKPIQRVSSVQRVFDQGRGSLAMTYKGSADGIVPADVY